MFSLPDINRLNDNAAAKAKKLKREAASKRKPCCEYWNCNRPATRSHLVFDIFSDDPKDVLHLCDQHDGYSGDPREGYFTCEACSRVMVENYTWELYRVDVDGRTLCLKCAAEEYFADLKNWVNPKQVKQVVLRPHDPALNGQSAQLFDAATGVLNVARCRHVLGVEQPRPAGIKFVDNAEFDSLDGHQISGRPLLDIITDLDQPFCAVLDAGYQFAVSVGVYVKQPPANPRRSSGLLQEAA